MSYLRFPSNSAGEYTGGYTPMFVFAFFAPLAVK